MSNPGWWEKEKSIKQKANESESIVHKHLNSGALSWKGDFSNETTLYDNKSTEHKSISVTEKMCEKLIEDALTMNKEHGILILDMPNYYVMCQVQKKRDL